MRYPIRMQITDPNSVLSDADQHQVENLIWLRLAPFKEMICNVRFQITRLDQGEFGREHVVKTTTRLKSGHAIESFTTRVSKGAVLIAAADHMKHVVDRRIRYESSWIYAQIRMTKTAARSVFQSIGLLFRSSGHKDPSPLS